MLKNSIRQLFRTKVRTILFFVLITVCSLLICLGGNLFLQCKINMENFKDVFVTIGTVEQTPLTVSRQRQYDAEIEGYKYYIQKEYGKIFSLSELDMEGVEYISGPEHRPSYSVYIPNAKLRDEKDGQMNQVLMEVTPLEDCVPAGPKKVKINRVIYSIYLMNVNIVHFCDHFNEHPDTMYADKSYVMSVDLALEHGFDPKDPFRNPSEYIPSGAPYSRQADKEGNLYPCDLPELSYEEVNDEYRASGHERYWQNYAKEKEYMEHTVPVTPTDDLNLMMIFYNHDINMVKGEVLSEDDFAQGNMVCILPVNFAERNNIEVGDTLTLPFRVADYSLPAAYTIYNSPLKADGSNFEVFFSGDYVVKGLYRQMPTDNDYVLADNEIIVPKKSITVDDSENIGNFGRYISPLNTTFRIPNGTIDEFMEQWEKKDISDVTIHFYDRGYSKIEDGIKQMEQMAVLLLLAGVIMTILVLIFFSSMMIGGQKKRTAIERSLGASKKECRKSLLSGILLLAGAGCIIGCILGGIMTKSVASAMTNNQIFDRTYSAGIVYSEGEEQTMNGDYFVTLGAFVSVFALTTLISFAWANKNLKAEPLELLSGKEN